MSNCSCHNLTEDYKGVCKQCNTQFSRTKTSFLSIALCELHWNQVHGSTKLYFNELHLCNDCNKTHNIKLGTGYVYEKKCSCNDTHDIKMMDCVCPTCKKQWSDKMLPEFIVRLCDLHGDTDNDSCVAPPWIDYPKKCSDCN